MHKPRIPKMIFSVIGQLPMATSPYEIPVMCVWKFSFKERLIILLRGKVAIGLYKSTAFGGFGEITEQTKEKVFDVLERFASSKSKEN
jgi:hypothetical protein